MAMIMEAVRNQNAITTGNGELDRNLGGGIPLGSLSLIEGQSDAGKSVLTQHLAYGAIRFGIKVAYYTTEDTVRTFMSQMTSLGMDVTDYFLLDRLRVYPLSFAADESKSASFAPSLLEHIQRLPAEFSCVMVDSLTNLIMHSSDAEVLEVFANCKRLCNNGRTISLVAHSDAFNETCLTRVRSVCDAHLRLRLQVMGETLMKILEVPKIHGAEKNTGKIVSFDVEPGLGIKVTPLSTAKA
jgi:flagellar protein FlaH